MKKTLSLILTCVIALCSFSVIAFADAAAWDMQPANYTVYVLTPDGGLNIRNGPGTEFNTVRSQPIPDYTELYIEYVSDGWGYTQYDGTYGWVYLGQTTREKPQKPTETTTAATTKKPAETQTTTQKTDPPQTTAEQTETTKYSTVTEMTSGISQISETEKSNSSMVRLIIILLVTIIALITISVTLVILLAKKNRG